MNNDVKFSVTVPAYKAQFLKECIDSILVQTYKNFELIIVNDASPQDLDSIVNSYHDSRIRYYKNKVGFGAENVVGNWNKCLEYAAGDYVICMGDDDRLLPDCLSEYVKLMELKPNLDLYHGMTEIIDEKSKVSAIQEPRPFWESVYSMIWWRWQGRRQYMGDWLFKVSTLKKNGGFVVQPFAWTSDDLSAMVAAQDKGVANTYMPVFQYRINRKTISNSIDNVDEKIKAHHSEFRKYYDFFQSIKPITELDETYYSFLQDNLEKVEYRSIGYEISCDMKSGFSVFLKWIFKKNFGVSRKSKLYALKIYLNRIHFKHIK